MKQFIDIKTEDDFINRPHNDNLRLMTCINIMKICEPVNYSNKEDFIYQRDNMIQKLVDVMHTWDMSSCPNVSYMFADFNFNKHKPNIAGWDFSSCVNMSYMFTRSYGLAVLSDQISGWNVSYVDHMKHMFSFADICGEFPDISKWNTGDCEDMSYMFAYITCTKFKANISKWDLSSCKYLSGIFEMTEFTLPKTLRWNTKNCIEMNNIFSDRRGNIPDISKWNVESCLYAYNMFENCEISNDFAPNISNWHFNKKYCIVIGMFYGCNIFQLKGSNKIKKFNEPLYTRSFDESIRLRHKL